MRDLNFIEARTNIFSYYYPVANIPHGVCNANYNKLFLRVSSESGNFFEDAPIFLCFVLSSTHRFYFLLKYIFYV